MSKHRNKRLEVVEKLYREYLGLPSVSPIEIIWHHQTDKECDVANLDTIEKVKTEVLNYDCIPLASFEHTEVHGNIPQHEWKPCIYSKVKSNTKVLEIIFDEIMKIEDANEFSKLKLSEIRKIYDF